MKKRNNFSFPKTILATIFLIIAITLGTSVQLLANEPVKVGIFQNKPVVYFEDGPKGLFVEILDHVAESEDWKIEYVPCELKECIELIKSNDLDIMTSLGKNPARLKSLTFSEEPIWTFWGTFYAHDLEIANLLDLKDKKIGVRRKNKITSALQELLTNFEISAQYVEFDNYESAFTALHDKKIDAVAVNNTYGFEKQRVSDIYQTSIVFSPFSAYFAAPKNGQHIKKLAVIDGYVKKLKADNESFFYTFQQKWFGGSQTYWTGKKIGIIGAIFLCSTIFVMAFWRYRSLVNLNKDLVQSIIDRNQTEEKLRYSEKRFRRLVETAADAIFLFNKQGKFELVNEQACKSLGYTENELLQLTVTDIDTQFTKKKVLEIISGEFIAQWPLTITGTHQCKDGSTFPVEVRVDKMETESGQSFVALARDITERKKTEEATQQQVMPGQIIENSLNEIYVFEIDTLLFTQVNKGAREVSLEKQLRQAMKMGAIGTLAGGIAHDFNNILAAVLGYGEMARAQLPADNPVRSDIDQVIKAGNRAKELVKQILTFSRQGDENFSPLKIQLITKEALKLLRSSLPTTIQIQANIDSNCQPVLADPTQIHQVIMNFCTNAKHAMDQNGGILTVSLSEVEVTGLGSIPDCPQLENGVYLDLEISDTGCGMDELTQSKIFDPFFTTKEIGKGTGLGLAVVHGIIKQHQGEITVASKPDKGTVFHIYLPVIDQEVQAVSVASVKDLPRGSERILLVDDEPIVVTMMQRMLDGLGYTVTTYTSSVEALDAYKASPDNFDLLVSDMTMPDLTGTVLAKKILAIRPDFPIIMCTGFSESMDEEKAKALGIKEYIMKPVLRNQLAVTVRKALAHG